MKEKKQSASLYLAVCTAILFFAIVAVLLVFMGTNRERITEQNTQYLEDAASQTAKRVNEIFDNAEMSIQMVSRLYELQLEEPRFDFRLLNDMSEPTPFDYIRFVSPAGISYSGDGRTIDCSDREYFTEGINGNSGVCFVEASRFVEKPIIVFYTPLRYNGDIIGVINGIISSKQFAKKLDMSFFGYSSNPCIFTQEGVKVAAAWDSDDETAATVPAGMSDSPEIKERVANVMIDSEAISLKYTGLSGDGIAFIMPIAEGRFVLAQTFPSTASKKITDKANAQALQLEVVIITLFIIYVILIVISYVRRNRRLASEKNDLSQIVDSVKRLYRRFIILDIENNRYEYLEDGEVSSFGVPSEGNYDEWVEVIRRLHEENPDCWSNMDDMSPEHLQKTITQQNWYSHRDYHTHHGNWERLSLIKLDMENALTKRILGAVEDITDTKKRDEENRKALETAFHAAEAASRAKSDFLSRMSHDIRTPMNAIVGLTAIMGSHLDDKERIVDCLTKITSSSKHLLGLINEVLDMSKIEAGKLALSDNEFSLPSLVDDLLSIVQPSVNAKHQDLTVNIRDITHEEVIGDNIRLQQVFVNILGNSVKYTDEGGHIKMTIRELPCNQPLLGKYEFTFEDDGIGMSPEFLEKIFAPFERAEDERVSSTQGTGLGLSIAQSIIRLMGGNISVESEEGKGTKFTVKLSLKLQEASDGSEERLIGLPVLVADDEQIACEATCLILEELGMHGEWVLSGAEAVEKVKEHHGNNNDFFAVILDWKMPGMDGVETARAIRREIGPDVPIIILSAYDWSEIENEARAAGVNAFIGKPLFRSRLRGVFVNLVSDSVKEPSDPLKDIKNRDFNGKRALLVEDNDLNQEIAKEILEMMNLTVDVAENGKVAVDIFNASAASYYDIVLMDIQMPIMNGLEAARAIRALPRDDAKTTPIIAMTANTFNEDVQASLDAGMNQHIGKPLDMNQLMSMLERWLR